MPLKPGHTEDISGVSRSAKVSTSVYKDLVTACEPITLKKQGIPIKGEIGFLFITGRAGAHWAAIRQAESRLPLKEIG
jgi:hypothetical protein